MRRRRAILVLGLFALLVYTYLVLYIAIQPTMTFRSVVTTNMKVVHENVTLDTSQLPVEGLYRVVRVRVNDSKIERMVNNIINIDGEFFPDWYWTATMATLVKTLGKRRRESGVSVVASEGNRTRRNVTGGWGELDQLVCQYSLYDPDDPAFTELIRQMTHSEFETIRENNVGVYLKVDVKFKDGGWAVLKPMKLPPMLKRESKYGIQHTDVAVFHLDRLLGHYRVPPTVGRHVNLQAELFPLLPDTIRSTFYINEDGRTCFFGACKWCKKEESYCGAPVTADVSLMYYLPAKAGITDISNPWFKERNVHARDGISESPLCSVIREKLTAGNRFPLEELDVIYFDALIGLKEVRWLDLFVSDSGDRHHYAAYTEFRQDTIPLLYDNTESFYNPNINKNVNKYFTRNNGNHCCLIKKTTFLKYLKLFLGPAHLSDLMRESLSADTFRPVLSDEHLDALNRRVNGTLLFVYDCLQNARHIGDVIIDDTT